MRRQHAAPTLAGAGGISLAQPARAAQAGGDEGCTMKSTDSLRIGDAERDAAIGALSRHFADGRLTQSEHEERVAAALTARTGSDLNRLFADLPRLDAFAPPDGVRAANGSRGSSLRAGAPLVIRLLTVVAAVVLLVHLVSVVVLLAFAFVGFRLVFGLRRSCRRGYAMSRSVGSLGRSPFHDP
jgi:DUF1707 SHOCT-like domain